MHTIHIQYIHRCISIGRLSTQYVRPPYTKQHAHNLHTKQNTDTYIQCTSEHIKLINPAPQTKHTHTTCNFTSLIRSAIINIQYTSETKGVLYDTSNTMSVQDSYICCYMNTTCIILHELYKQMQLSHVHTTGRPHNLQRQP